METLPHTLHEGGYDPQHGREYDQSSRSCHPTPAEKCTFAPRFAAKKNGIWYDFADNGGRLICSQGPQRLLVAMDLKMRALAVPMMSVVLKVYIVLYWAKPVL